MPVWVTLRSWLRTVFRRSTVDRELDDELRFHVDEEIAAAVRSGRSLEDARRLAAESLGDAPHRVKEQCREARAAYRLEAVAQDLRVGCRTFIRAPGFTVSALLILAVGNAAVTTMFALVNGVLLQPLPVRDQAALIVAAKQFPGGDGFHTPFRLLDDDGNRILDFIERETRAFEGIAGVNYNGSLPIVAADDGGGGTVRVAAVTGNFFDVLDLTPTLGRTLQPSDDVTGSERVVLITEGLWRRRYGASADVIGRRLRLNRTSLPIVGVVPGDLDYPRGVEAFLTTAAFSAMSPNPAFVIDVALVARLRPGVTRDQSRADLQQMLRRVEETTPDAPRGAVAVVRPFAEVVVGDSRSPLLVLFAAVVLVLVVASANVAGLCLMRAESRREEFAVRTALGAGRARLVAQLLVESTALSVCAVAAGVLIAWWAMPVLVSSLPEGLPRIGSPRIDLRVVTVSAVLALVTTMLTGIVPALRQVQRHGSSGLRPAMSRVEARQRTRRLLVVGQVAVAVTVLAAAALLARSLLTLQTVDTGLTSNQLVFTAVDLPQPEYQEPARQLQLLDQIAEQLGAAPGIQAVTAVAVPPFAGPRGWDVPRFTVEGQDDSRAAVNPTLNLESVLSNYFETLGIPIVRGRAFGASDRRDGPPVAIVSQDVASRMWPGTDPIGKRLRIGPLTSDLPWLTVVGVAAHTRYRDLREPRPSLYLPATQFIVSSQMLVVRTGLEVSAVDALVRGRLNAIDPDIQVMRTAGFHDLMAQPLSRPRFFALLGVIFGGITLLLSAAGLYSVVNASVRQRDREIGVRIAVGATRGIVLRLIMREGLQLAAAGLAVGFVIAVALTRFLDQLLFSVRPLDPGSMLTAVFMVAAVTALASLAPAVRAMQMNPAETLKAE